MKNHDFECTSDNGDLSVDDRNAVLAQVEVNLGGRNISLVASNHPTKVAAAGTISLNISGTAT